MTAPARATASRVVRQARDAREHRVLDRVRHLRVADGAAVRPGLVVERGEQLLDVERDAVRPLVDGVDDLARRRQAGPEDERDHERRLVLREGLEAGLLGEPLAEQASRATRGGSSRPAARRAGTRRARSSGRSSPEARELADDLEAELVGPLEVVEGEQRRPVDGLDDAVGDVVDEDPPRSERVCAAAAVDARAAVRPSVPNAAFSRIVAREVEDRRERDLAVMWGEIAPWQIR